MKIEGYNFADVCAKARQSNEKRFIEGATEAKLEDTDWVWEDELELLREEMSSVSDQCRADETKKMVNQTEVSHGHPSFICALLNLCLLQRTFRRQIAEPVELHLNTASADMWDKVLTSYRELLEKSEAVYLSKARSKSTLHWFVSPRADCSRI